MIAPLPFGALRHRGVLVWHVGCAVDQPAAIAAIDAAEKQVRAVGVSAAELAPLLSRCVVRLVPAVDVPEAMRAWWSGWPLDIGKVRVHLGHGWDERLAAGLVALVLSEARPGYVVDGVEVVH